MQQRRRVLRKCLWLTGKGTLPIIWHPRGGLMAASVIFAVLLKSISRQIGRGRLRLILMMRGVVWHPR